MRIRRDDLYAQIWREPMTTVAKRLDVSSNYLARVCDSLNVPHPSRGYWARKAAGESLEVPLLPPVKPGDAVEWVRGEGVPEREAVTEYVPPSTTPKKPRPLSSGHDLVTAWRAHMEEASPTENGYMRPRKRNVLDAFVTKGMVRHAATGLNALFIELENRGHSVQLRDGYHRPPLDVARRPIDHNTYPRSDSWQPGKSTVAHLGNLPIGLSLFELTEHVRVRRRGDRYVRMSDLPAVKRYATQFPDESDTTRDMPTGRLVLRAYFPRWDVTWSEEWEESEQGRLEARVSDIVDALEAAAPTIATLVAEAEARALEERRQWEAQQRAERRKELQAARAEARKRSIEELKATARAWTEAHALEAFFKTLEARAVELDSEDRAELEVRIRTARTLLGGEEAVQRFLRWRQPSAQVELDEQEDS